MHNWTGDVMARDCPSREVLRQVTSRWGGLVILFLQDGPRRFSDLRAGIGGISERMLAKTLQDLVALGLVRRTAYPEVPPRVDYDLTEIGRETAGEVGRLIRWVEANAHRMSLSGDEARA